MDQDALNKIRKTVTENPVVLYMKGAPIFRNAAFPGVRHKCLRHAVWKSMLR